MQLLAFILVYPILWIISILPFRLLYAFSDLLFFLLYHAFGYRKKTVRENLELVFPEKSTVEIKQITRDFYHHLCDMIVEAIKSMTISKSELRKRFTFKNVDLILDLENENRNTILMCAHYGSWEWIFILQDYIKSDGYAIYKRLRNKYFDRLVKKIRARHNSYLITTKETYNILKETARGEELSIYGFASDQSPKPSKAFHWGNFMDIKVPMYTGAETLAKKYNLAVVFFRVKRLKRGFYETEFELITKDPNSFKDYEITDTFFRLVEELVKSDPGYYLWTHKRWKHRDKVPEQFK